MVKEPLPALKRAYNWGDTTQPLDHQRALENLVLVLRTARISAKLISPALSREPPFSSEMTHTVETEAAAMRVLLLEKTSVADRTLYSIGFEIFPVQAADGERMGFLVKPVLLGAADVVISLSEDFAMKWSVAADAGEAIGCVLFPDEADLVGGTVALGTRLEITRTSQTPWYVLGNERTARVELSAFSTSVSLEGDADDPELILRVAAKKLGGPPGCKVVIPMGEADSFASKLVNKSSLEMSFSPEVIWSSKHGLTFNGSPNLKIDLPQNIPLGPITLTRVSVELGESPAGSSSSAGVACTVGLNVKGTIGPIDFVIQRIGFSCNISRHTRDELLAEQSGDPPALGGLGVSLSFAPPKGLGLSVDGGGFKGGGFLEFAPAEHQYSGFFELQFQDQITLKAFGLLSTRLPNNQPGFSLLIIITAEFTPIQLGFGFKLNGVGGLLGLHRTVQIEPLRTGLRDNTLSNILFPTDIIANADRILSDLKQAFPPAEGRFIFGPMAKITWGTPTRLTIDLGLVLEVPDPVRLLILGVLRGILPDERAAILRLQVNFLGEINFQRKQLSFDASLFDSKLLAFTLSGDMAIRLYWGADANFLLTVGGFHPAFQPPPMNLPAIRRLTLSLLQGNNPRLTLELYFAVTSNTVQFGAKLELYASAWKFNVYGFLSFDVLFQFNPFYFIAEITAMLALRVGTSSFASIKLEFTLEGPTPWKAKGTAKFKICWFFTLKVRFNKTFGEARNTTLPDLEVLPLLMQALNADDNWEGEVPTHRHNLETIKEVGGVIGQIFVHPVGMLKVSQKVVPLNIRIDRIGAQRPSDGREFGITAVQLPSSALPPVDVVQESFAPAQFFDMKDEEKLGSPSFKSFDSGVRIGDPERLHTAYAAARAVQYELKYIDSQRDQLPEGPPNIFDVDPLAFNTWTLQGAIAQSDLSFARNRKSKLAPQEVAVAEEPFAIVNTSDLTLFDELSLLGSERVALTRVNALIESNPALRGQLQVVPAFELAA